MLRCSVLIHGFFHLSNVENSLFYSWSWIHYFTRGLQQSYDNIFHRTYLIICRSCRSAKIKCSDVAFECSPTIDQKYLYFKTVELDGYQFVSKHKAISQAIFHWLWQGISELPQLEVILMHTFLRWKISVCLEAQHSFKSGNILN